MRQSEGNLFFPESTVARMGLRRHRSMEDALAGAIARYGASVRILVAENPDFTVLQSA